MRKSSSALNFCAAPITDQTCVYLRCQQVRGTVFFFLFKWFDVLEKCIRTSWILILILWLSIFYLIVNFMWNRSLYSSQCLGPLQVLISPSIFASQDGPLGCPGQLHYVFCWGNNLSPGAFLLGIWPHFSLGEFTLATLWRISTEGRSKCREMVRRPSIGV